MKKPPAEFAVESETAESATDSVRPYWIPAGVSFEALPEELKAAIAGLVNPAYRSLVLEAVEGLERSTGMTIVYLLWLEIVDQMQLGADSINNAPDPEKQKKREAQISRYMRTVATKNQTTNLLLRMYEFRQKWGALTPPPDPLRTSSPN